MEFVPLQFIDKVVHFMDDSERRAALRVPVFKPSIDRFERNKSSVEVQFYDGHFYSLLDYQKEEFNWKFVESLDIETPRFEEVLHTNRITRKFIKFMAYKARQVVLCFNSQELDMNLLQMVIDLKLPVHILNFNNERGCPASEETFQVLKTTSPHLQILNVTNVRAAESQPFVDLFFEPSANLRQLSVSEDCFMRYFQQFCKSRKVLDGTKLFQIYGHHSPTWIIRSRFEKIRVSGDLPLRIGKLRVPQWMRSRLVIGNVEKLIYESYIYAHPTIPRYVACVVLTLITAREPGAMLQSLFFIKR